MGRFKALETTLSVFYIYNPPPRSYQTAAAVSGILLSLAILALQQGRSSSC